MRATAGHSAEAANRRLIQMRWVAVVGVLLVLCATGPMFGLFPVTWPSYVVVGLLAGWNAILAARLQRKLSAQPVGSQCAIDLLLLGTLLYFGGGLHNPFAIFLVVQVVLASILAPLLIVPLGSLASLILLLLALLGASNLLPGEEHMQRQVSATEFPWALAGAMLLTGGIAVPFAARLMTDLAESKQAAEEGEAVRRAAEAQLFKAEKLSALGRLAAGMAHEVNTPLGSVRLLASECEDELASAHPDLAKARACLEDIRSESARIGGLVRRLLDLAHPGESEREPVDIDKLLRESVRLVALRDPELQRRISLQVPEALPQPVTVRTQLLQVLLNGLDNAVDATRDNAGAIHVEARIEGPLLAIHIEDEGSGVAAESQARLFEPFFTTKVVGEGTGLGLYVSFAIMQSLGGRIALTSKERGARLRIEIPCT
jgi:signal transduction histidine kinase